MKKDVFELQRYQRRTAWKKAHGEQRGEQIGLEAEGHFARVDLAYRALLGTIGQGLIAALSVPFDGPLARYREQKRAAAVVDFHDLLVHARDLVSRHEDIRRAVGQRYRHIFVDEFQDTDPIQAELLFLIAAEARPARWQEAVLRPGALFLVGDPKQAIHRFRGADVEVYNSARANVPGRSGGAIIEVTANFRSRRGILDHVNTCFAPVLSRVDQPGYVPLAHTVEPPDHGLPCVAKLTVNVPQGESSDGQREAEAHAVAEVCHRLIGALEIVRPDGTRSRLRGGDIALLAPTSRDLWRYERALETKRISVASQAGRTLFLRQETQDVLALLRTMADASDTLAFGALMRGPLVGLTDNELLEVTAALSEGDRQGVFNVLSDIERIPHPLARSVLEALQRLRRRTGSTTPALLLSQAIEELSVRVVLTARHHNRSARALANVDALIGRARPYGMSGLQAFVRDLQRDWEQKSRVAEGRTDASEDAVELVTMHSSKGLEWPVVIPINTATILRSVGQFVLRRSDNTLHWVLGGVPPPHLDQARAEENAGEARQRERLWYVACSRARDLLIIPHLPGADSSSWSRIVELGQARLSELELAGLPEPVADMEVPVRNEQSSERFVAEAEKVARASPAMTWRRPSDHDPDRALLTTGPVSDFNDTAEVTLAPGAGRMRGIILHKLMEEFLTGELLEDDEAVHARARLLTEHARSTNRQEAETPDPSEMASTALRTIRASEIARLRPFLVPELSVWAEHEGECIAGRADALAIEENVVTMALDWKSDIAPTAQDRAQHAAQLSEYRDIVGAARAAVVYMSLGEIAWL
jgi:ATP-dependent exoDNAse (exonuclease V) beta subunit